MLMEVAGAWRALSRPTFLALLATFKGSLLGAPINTDVITEVLALQFTFGGILLVAPTIRTKSQRSWHSSLLSKEVCCTRGADNT